MYHKLSIITINYNNKSGLVNTVESVLMQSYTNYEYIIIDGGSTDGSAEFIASKKEVLTYWLSEPDEGIYHAMNKGIENSNGDYLIFLNSGDMFLDAEILKKCISFCEENPDKDIYYGNVLMPSGKNQKLPKEQRYPEELTLPFFKVATINHQASLINCKLFKDFDQYPVKYKLASDYWLFLKSFLSNKEFKYFNFQVVIYDVTGQSSASFDLYKKEMRIIWDELVPKSLDSLISENKKYKRLFNRRLVRYAVSLANFLNPT